MSVVSEEVARGEVNKWLDFQCISEKTREQLQTSVNRLTEGVIAGLVVIKEDNTVIQKLRFPIGKEEKVLELKFKPSITVGDVQKHLRGNDDANDAYAGPMAHICAATGEALAVIQNLNKKDYNLSDAIIVFFML